MPVSSDILFHFTNSIDNLISILENDFRAHYSLEDYTGIFADKPLEELKLALPMVSFCDIPLSLIGEHVGKYGYYGIGLTKEWGQKNRITPVLYIHERSFLLDFLWNLLEVFNNFEESDKNEIFNILRFTKPYDGNTWRGEIKVNKITFYNEREWRYVPRSNHLLLSKEEFLNEETRNRNDLDIWGKFAINFVPDDIRYLILKDDSEILPFVRKIEEIKRNRFSEDTVKILTTRIITYETLMTVPVTKDDEN